MKHLCCYMLYDNSKHDVNGEWKKKEEKDFIYIPLSIDVISIIVYISD